MQRVVTARVRSGKQRLNSFTLVELLVVMAIILILVAITLQAASGVMQMAARSRCRAEIQAMSTALESYKSDNGAYPVSSSSSLLTNSAAAPYFSSTIDGSGTIYQSAAQTLYEALSGKINYADTTLTAGGKAYLSFKTTQLGGSLTTTSSGTVTSTSTYVQDPWSYAYGYSTGTTTSYPFNGTGFFDLWSTAGLLYTGTGANCATNSATWISNW